MEQQAGGAPAFPTHESMKATLEYMADRNNWEADAEDGYNMLRPGKDRQEGIIMVSRHLCPWILAQQTLQGHSLTALVHASALSKPAPVPALVEALVAYKAAWDSGRRHEQVEAREALWAALASRDGGAA